MDTDSGINRSDDLSVGGSLGELEQLISPFEGSDYVEAVVELAEQSERHFLAAVSAGQVVNGFASSTNF